MSAAGPLQLTGFGLATPLGATFRQTASALADGRSAYRKRPEMIGADFKPVIAALADWPIDLDPGERLDRWLDLAVGDPGLRAGLERARGDLGVVLVLREAEEGGGDGGGDDRGARLAALEAALRETARVDAPVTARAVVPGGHAGGARALALAAGWLAEGRCGRVVAAAVDTYAPRPRLARLVDADRLFNGLTNPWGFVPGEAAVALCLGRAGSDVPAVLVGAGEAVEAVGERDEGVTRYDGLSAAAFAALDALGRDAVAGHWLADLNNARYRASEAGIVAQRLRLNRRLDGEGPGTLTPYLGDVGAASLFLQLVLAGDRVRSSGADRAALATAGSWTTRLRGAAAIRFRGRAA